MHNTRTSGVRAAIGGAAMIAVLCVPPAARAQDWDGHYRRLSRIEAGTFVTVRTTRSIVAHRSDGRIFDGVVAEDVWDDYRRLAVPAIPRGSRVELIVRTARDGDLILDLESVFAHGQRYAVSAVPERIESDGAISRRDDTAEFVGGGALLGTIVGAIAGGGKGAAIGAAAGAASGLGLALRGRDVRIPAGSLVTFQLERALLIGVYDDGFTRNRWHYHRYPDEPYPFDRRYDRR